MDAAVLRELGQTPRCEPFPEPTAGEGEELIEVLAAALKPVDRQLAAGTHYAAPRRLPAVCGTDGVGRLGDGRRVFFGGCRSPYGAMAQRTVAPQAFAFPLPEELDDATAAALPNPGVSAWLALSHRAQLAPGEQVLILGATGVAGGLAVQIAKLLGAGRVVAAGRNLETLRSRGGLGADATIRLDAPDAELREAFAREAGAAGFQVVIDFVWGRPAEQFLETMTRGEFAAAKTETRFVQMGESAGAEIRLRASALRSAPLAILGTGGVPPGAVLANALREVLARAARGELRVETERAPLAEVEQAWRRDQPSRRVVLTP